MKAGAKPANSDLNFDEFQFVPNGETVINADIVFKAMMTHDYASLKELSLIGVGLTLLNEKNTILRQMTNIKRLNLSHNNIAVIQHLDALKQITELDLSFNRIEKIQNINMPQLTILDLSGNQIKRIENLKTLKKLERLNLTKNKITEPSL
jgi:internalin A